MRRRSQRNLLPTTQKPVQPPTFTERHITNLREWQKLASNSASTDSAWSSLKTDPGHHPFLAQPKATYQK
ncbi:hypothetical protein IQ06DRAFT_292391 [Phaeosphaeriaceae sp. SRC1lsM3a]|nr:hypothetical protein IQ06DRAFT_292391 [Stagonospora sp. SRC1lsM3a]